MVVAAQRERASALFVADDLAATNGFALSTGFLPSPVDPKPELNNAAPSVQLHYRAFLPTTGCSAPVPRISTPILVQLGIKPSPCLLAHPSAPPRYPGADSTLAPGPIFGVRFSLPRRDCVASAPIR